MSLTPEQAFARRLRERRDELNMSQAEVAARCADLGYPLDRTAITKIEKGTRSVSLDDAMALTAALATAPVFMFFPLQPSEHVDIGSVSVRPNTGRSWCKGERPLLIETDAGKFVQARAAVPDEVELADASRTMRTMLDDINEYLWPLQYGSLDADSAAELGQLLHHMRAVLDHQIFVAERTAKAALR